MLRRRACGGDSGPDGRGAKRQALGRRLRRLERGKRLAQRQWLAYVRAAGIVAFGSRDRLDYAATSVSKTAASFEGDSSFSTAAFIGGGGVEWGFNGPWSLGIEYLHANFGSGSRYTASCTGSASACAAFSGITFVNSHSALDTNIVRVGINYWFGYWEP